MWLGFTSLCFSASCSACRFVRASALASLFLHPQLTTRQRRRPTRITAAHTIRKSTRCNSVTKAVSEKPNWRPASCSPGCASVATVSPGWDGSFHSSDCASLATVNPIWEGRSRSSGCASCATADPMWEDRSRSSGCASFATTDPSWEGRSRSSGCASFATADPSWEGCSRSSGCASFAPLTLVGKVAPAHLALPSRPRTLVGKVFGFAANGRGHFLAL